MALWNRDFPTAFVGLEQEWSESVKPIMQAVKGKFLSQK